MKIQENHVCGNMFYVVFMIIGLLLSRVEYINVLKHVVNIGNTGPNGCWIISREKVSSGKQIKHPVSLPDSVGSNASISAMKSNYLRNIRPNSTLTSLTQSRQNAIAQNTHSSQYISSQLVRAAPVYSMPPTMREIVERVCPCFQVNKNRNTDASPNQHTNQHLNKNSIKTTPTVTSSSSSRMNDTQPLRRSVLQMIDDLNAHTVNNNNTPTKDKDVFIGSSLVSRFPLVNTRNVTSWTVLHDAFIDRNEGLLYGDDRYKMKVEHGLYMEDFTLYKTQLYLNATLFNDRIEESQRDRSKEINVCSYDIPKWLDPRTATHRIVCSSHNHSLPSDVSPTSGQCTHLDQVLVVFNRDFINIYHNFESIILLWRMYLKMSSFPLFKYIIFWPPKHMYADWVVQSLTVALSVYPEDIRPQFLGISDLKSAVCVRRAIVMTLPRVGIKTIPQSYEEPMLIRKYSYKYFSLSYVLTSPQSLRVLHITRPGTTRQVLNMKDLHECLRVVYGDYVSISVADFSAIPFHIQMTHMMKADIVMSIHGAALTNIPFMLPLSGLIEFMNPYQGYVYYRNMAIHCLLFYEMIEGRSGRQQSYARVTPRDMNIIVPVDHFKQSFDVIAQLTLTNKYCYSP